MTLTALRLDALREAANIGMSRAATLLSELLDDEIELDIPQVTSGIATLPHPQEQATLAAVYQPLLDPVRGRVLLLVPGRESRSLVNALIGERPALRSLDPRELEHEAFTEIGNIIISACVSAVADLLGHEIRIGTPRFAEGGARELLRGKEFASEPGPLVLQADLRARRRGLEGTLMLVLAADALHELLNLVDALLRRIGAEPSP